MSDYEAIQGLWRLVSIISQGQEAFTAVTHYLFSGGTYRQIDPNRVDSGKLRATFRLDESADPKRVEFVLDYNGPDGPPDPKPLILRELYRLDGDSLTLCSGVAGIYPEALSDQYSLTTLERDPGPVPETRQPSGTPPLEDVRLGALAWDDNFGEYAGSVTVGGAKFRLSLAAGEDKEAATALASAQQIVGEFDQRLARTKAFAAQELLPLKNDEWLDTDENEQPLSEDQFAARMTLESLSVHADGRATFTFDDGDLFFGHVIQVGTEADGSPTDAEMAG